MTNKEPGYVYKCNENLFPDDFMFRLTAEEWTVISSQFVMTSRAKRPKTAFKYCDHTKELEIHEALQKANESINKLGLVPINLCFAKL
jgi:hypothetical protein